jgi:5-methylcytosine-specific restriction endonuclease McrA
VHHIVPIEEDWNKRLNFDNLVLLCPDCHNAEHERISPLQKFLKDWENI